MLDREEWRTELLHGSNPARSLPRIRDWAGMGACVNGGRFGCRAGQREPPTNLTFAAPYAFGAYPANMAAPATLASQSEVLDRIFTGLKDKSHETRLQAAIDLQRYVRTLTFRACICGLTRHIRFPIPYQTSLQMLQQNCGMTQLAGCLN
jgi:hypothetical protein